MDIKNMSNDEIDLSLTLIEGMPPNQLYMMSKKFEIKDYQDLTEMKQKIILSVMKRKKTVMDTNFYTQDFQDKKEYTFKEDELRRNYLKKYLINISAIYDQIKTLAKIKTPSQGGIDISEKDDPLITKITNEFPNIDEQFHLKQKIILRKPHCALLICGDSGAGKSSFINLLVSERLLPTSIRSNTACQVQLTYDQHERAEIIDLEQNKVIIEKEDFPTELQKYLENLDDRTQTSCKSASIYLNKPILEGGLDIYDTIGLGETTFFNEELTKDLTEITGILFLLKKNNPIGDNNVGGPIKVINHMLSNGIPVGSIHFIINMCDLLEGSNEKKELKSNVVDQLREKCKFLNPEITTFSTKRELFLQENQVMSKDYRDIMTLIQQLHINSINTNTVSIFEFLFQFVWKTIEYIVESEEFAANDKVSKKDYILKLRNLESDRKLLNQSFKRQSEKFLKERYDKYKREVVKHFNQSETRLKVINEVVAKHTELFGMTNKDQIDQEITTFTQNSILTQFKLFVEKQNMLKICCDDMLSLFIQQFAEHQQNKDKINRKMNRRIDSVMNDEKGDLTTINLNDLIGLPNYQKKFLQLFAPIIVPGIEFKNIVRKGFENWFSWIISKINTANIQKFYEDTHTYVSNKSGTYYNKFIKGDQNIKMLMDLLFRAPKKVTVDFDKYLSEDMNYLAKNINLLDEDVRNKEKVIQTYKEIKEKLENIINDLCYIDLLFLQKDKNDIMEEEVEILSHGESEYQAQVPILSNRNVSIFHGKFKKVELTGSAVLVYNNVEDKCWKQIYQDYKKHREILKRTTKPDNSERLKCFVKLRFHILSSISYEQDLRPKFCVDGIDHSLKSYITEYKESLTDPNTKEIQLHSEISKLLTQILNGLSYLHENELVHYDLIMESIGYNSIFKTIKLSSISLETHVKIDYSITSRNYVNSVAHFPLKILKQNSTEKYTASSDMYCLGSIIYQLWVGISPFFDIIQNKEVETVDQFVDLLERSKFRHIILHSMSKGGFADMVHAWSCQCWENKMTSQNFYNQLLKPTYYGEILN